MYAGNLVSDLLCRPDLERLERATQFLQQRFQIAPRGLVDLAAEVVDDVRESASLFEAGPCTIHESVLDAVRELIAAMELAAAEG